MASDRRRSTATAVTGSALVGAGAQARHAGVERAVRASGRGHPRVHPAVFIRQSAGRRLYGAGSVAGVVGATGLGVGLHNLARRPAREEVGKARRDGAGDFIAQGIGGTSDALRERAEAARRPQASAKARAAAAGASAGAGALGSLGARRVIRGSVLGRRLSPAAGAVAGTVAAVGSLPVTNAVARRKGYEVTPTGVKRRKTTPVRPTRTARVVETRAGRGISTPYARGQIVPSDQRVGKIDYSTLSDNQKRARVYAAGTTPVVGPFAAAAQAGRMAPDDQRRSTEARQVGGYYAGAATGGVLGGGAALLGARNPGVDAKLQSASDKIAATRGRIAGKLPGRVGRLVAPSGPGRVGRAVTGLAGRPGAVGRVASQVAAHPGAAAIGGWGGKAAGAAIGSYAAYSASLRRQHERDAKLNSVGKAVANGTGMTAREQREQLKRKRHNLGVSMLATGVGATGVGLLAAREVGPKLPRVGAAIGHHAPALERAGLSTALVGGGIGSYQGAQSARIQRRDLDAQERQLSKAKVRGVLVPTRSPGLRSSFIRSGPNGPVRVRNTVAKMATTMNRSQADQVKHQYGIKGPLPRGLSREEKMRAYEGRYVAAGGPKGERWQRRSDDLDHVTGATIAGAAGGIGAKFAAETKPGHRVLTNRGIHPPHFASRAGRVAEGLGAAGALSELAHRHAQHKAGSYRSSPAGVAASALTRMRNYSPDD